MRIAYVTPDYCGAGHAMRGIALVQAGNGSVRAFGPVPHYVGTRDLDGYQGSNDWRSRVLRWQPDLLIGDLRPEPLDTLRIQLGVPSWLLMRIWPYSWRDAPFWSRVIAIEPGVDPLMGLRDSIPPIVGPQRMEPEAGTVLRAGYNSFWEAHRYGYADRVTWLAKGPEQERRVRFGGDTFSENGADVLVRMAEDELVIRATAERDRVRHLSSARR